MMVQMCDMICLKVHDSNNDPRPGANEWCTKANALLKAAVESYGPDDPLTLDIMLKVARCNCACGLLDVAVSQSKAALVGLAALYGKNDDRVEAGVVEFGWICVLLDDDGMNPVGNAMGGAVSMITG